MGSANILENSDTINTMAGGPIPLSFPAILRNPGISNRFAHLQLSETTVHAPVVPKKLRRADNEGKRWVRRNENTRFVGNPHIVHASKQDYVLQYPLTKQTFPEPLPSYLPRIVKLGTVTVPARNPHSANAGRFSLSLRGMRRDLRRAGFRAQVLVRDVEHEITEWLQGGAMLSPDTHASESLQFPGSPVGNTGTISEVDRTPLQMIWLINDDTFARYVVHCCARYHEIVSFSKEVSGRRLTYMLRPNVTRPDSYAAASLDTPPATDIDYSSHVDTDRESDILSDSLSDIIESEREVRRDTTGNPLSPTIERPSVNSQLPETLTEDSWSVIGSDADGDESGNEFDLTASIDSLSLHPIPESENHDQRPQTFRMRVGNDRRNQSTSSPSRSPLRRPSRGIRLHGVRATPRHEPRKSFYDYLFL